METNLTKYKKDIDNLIDRGGKLLYGLVYELRDDLEDDYKQIPKKHRIEIEKSFYVGDETYCRECYEKHAQVCEKCGDAYLEEDMVYNEQEDIYYCRWCSNHKN